MCSQFWQNFISHQAFRDIWSLRAEFESSLDSLGFILRSTKELNINSDNPNLLKSIILAGLWPRVAKVVLPKAMFNKISSGTIQREHEAKEVKYFTQAGESGGRGEGLSPSWFGALRELNIQIEVPRLFRKIKDHEDFPERCDRGKC